MALFLRSRKLYSNFPKLYSSTQFVPRCGTVEESELEKLQDFVDNCTSILILTGAGISTESGIPDYRSEKVGLYARTNHKPIQHQEFMKSKYVRQRYWARNFVGWSTFSGVRPNSSHLILTTWQQRGKISQIVTQNVDRLHHKAGCKAVLELHGSAYDVKCMNCGFAIDRHDFQNLLTDSNPSFSTSSIEMRPDADADLPQEMINNFQLPHCNNCQDAVQGFFKPDIVFFGDNVPKERVEKVYSELESSDSLLVIGSSLQVYSGYRFILKANELNKPVAIINIGETRGDKFAHIKLSGKCSDVLSKICT